MAVTVERSGVLGRTVRRRSVLVGLTVGVAALAALAAQAITAAPPPTYVTLPVSVGPVITALTATGRVNPETVVQVGSYVSGVVQSVQCDFNTRVKKGQLCAELDNRPFVSAVEQDSARLATARAQLSKERINLEFAAKAAERNTSLHKRSLVSQETADQYQSLYQQARAQVMLAEAMERQYEAALRASSINLGYTKIISPVDGVVISSSVAQGQTVNAAFQTPTLFLVATDLSRMQVNAFVSEADIGGVQVGAPVLFTVSSAPLVPMVGTVAQVRSVPQSVQGVITYDVVVSADNTAGLLKPGMTAVVRIQTQRRDNVLRAPSSALRYLHDDGRGAGGEPQLAVPPPAPVGVQAAGRPGEVWLLRDGKPGRTAVRTGLDDDMHAELLDPGGVRPGDVLIVGVQPGAEPKGWMARMKQRMGRLP